MKTKKWSRQDRLGNILFLVILGGGLLALILNLVLPDKADSDTENRPLAQISDIQARGLWTGETGREVSDWYADQFPLRNTLLHLNYCVQRLEGVSEIDDVYIGSHMLLQQAPAYDAAVSDQNLQAIRDFQAKTGIPVNVQIVPTSIAVNADRLPMNATSADEAAAIADIQSKSQDLGFINSLDTLASHKDEDLYYATDHHWKSRGAWYAWTDLAAAKGWSADEAAFDILKAADGFQGTLSAKTGDPFLSDTVEIWVPKNGPEYVMTKDGVKSRTMYDESALDRRDKYQVFTGPNTGEFTLEMDNDSPVRLLLFKDSYA
ncbi:DHHW family protein, partial [Faecalibaculum rodentium]